MPRRTLFWQIFPSYLAMTWLLLLALTWYGEGEVRQAGREALTEEVETAARLVRDGFNEALAAPDPAAAVAALANAFGRQTSLRLTVVDAGGRVIGETEGEPGEQPPLSEQPALNEALAGRTGRDVRPGPAQGQDMIYFALPLHRDGRVAGALRVGASTARVADKVANVERFAFWAALGAVLLAAMVAWAVASTFNRRLARLAESVGDLAAGRHDLRVPVSSIEEVGALGEALNRLAQSIQERLGALTEQRNEQEAVFSSIEEAVLAVDDEERVINLNRAGARLVGLEPAAVRGRSLQEVLRNSELQAFVQQVLTHREPAATEVTVYDQAERVLQANGAVLRDVDGDPMGAVLVLNDITHLRRLETMRRDFVANVSHELRTPVTAIKGFLETLHDSDLKDADTVRRFVDIAARHADRLNKIIEDLLSLSRIEREQAAIELADTPLAEVLRNASQVCEPLAAQMGVTIEVTCAETLRAPVNAPLLEQALVNLIENAVKYGGEKQTVRVTATREADDAIALRVTDQGPGIEARHLERLFERFYRVDLARSRQQGGTGLGLAIVKHIAQAHRGTVGVDTAPGRGSTFSIHLPAQVPPQRAGEGGGPERARPA